MPDDNPRPPVHYIVQELMAGGSLHERLHQQQPLPRPGGSRAWGWYGHGAKALLQVAKGLHFLHRRVPSLSVCLPGHVPWAPERIRQEGAISGSAHDCWLHARTGPSYDPLPLLPALLCSLRVAHFDVSGGESAFPSLPSPPCLICVARPPLQPGLQPALLACEPFAPACS